MEFESFIWNTKICLIKNGNVSIVKIWKKISNENVSLVHTHSLCSHSIRQIIQRNKQLYRKKLINLKMKYFFQVFLKFHY